MFIRWKRRKKKADRTFQDRGDSLYCVLVESKRVNGSPRQKVVCYLGSVDEGDRERLCVRVNFWDRVTEGLGKLDRLNPDSRKQIEASIERVVTRPGNDEAEQFRKERQAFREALRQMLTR